MKLSPVLFTSLVAGSAVIAALVLLQLAARRRALGSLRAFRLTFPRGMETATVTAFLGALSGLLLPWWRRWRQAPAVVLEVHASERGIEHFALVPAAWAETVTNLLQAAAPAIRYEPTDPPQPLPRLGAEYRLSTNARALRVDPAGLSAALLASLQPLVGEQQSVVVQWVLTPAPPVAPARQASTAERERLLPPPGVAADGEAAAALRQKQAYPLLLAVGRIATSAGSRAGARSLLRQVEAAWHASRAPGVHLQRSWQSERSVARRVARRHLPLIEWPTTLNAQELSGLVGWPIEAVSVPGLVLGASRLVAAGPIVPRVGTVIADSNFPGDPRPLALDLEARMRGVHVLGPTGTGKSVLLADMIVSDLLAGYGVIALDRKGDLARDLLSRIPSGRRGDICLFDPADDHPIGINPLRSVTASAEVSVENLLGLFKSLYRSSWGPRTDDIFRAALMVLAQTEGATLTELPLLLTDPGYRRKLVGRLDDPVGLESFFGWYEGLSDAERLAVVGPVLNKVRSFTMRPRLRAIIGQSDPKLDFGEVLRSGKVVLVSLAGGVLGEEAAALLGALLVSEVWNATTARAGLAASERRPVMAYLDEWQRFVHLPTPMAEVLAESRGLRVGWTLAHQSLTQLPDEAKNAVLSNARSRITFQLPAADARVIARELRGVLSAEDLQGLGAYEVAAQLFAAGSTQPVATGRTRPMVPPTSDPEEIKAWSRDRYGTGRDEVERAIRARQAGRSDAAAVRRRPTSGSGAAS